MSFKCRHCQGLLVLVLNTQSLDRRMARVRLKAALAPAAPVKKSLGRGGGAPCGHPVVAEQHQLHHHGFHDGAPERRVQGGFRRVWHGEGSSVQWTFSSSFVGMSFCLFCSPAEVWLHSDIKVLSRRRCYVCFGFHRKSLCNPFQGGVKGLINKFIWSVWNIVNQYC